MSALELAREFVERHTEMQAMLRKQDAVAKELDRVTGECQDVESAFARAYPGETFIIGNRFLCTDDQGHVTEQICEVLS